MSSRLNDCLICGECFPADLKDCPFCNDDTQYNSKYKDDEQ